MTPPPSLTRRRLLATAAAALTLPLPAGALAPAAAAPNHILDGWVLTAHTDRLKNFKPMRTGFLKTLKDAWLE